MLIAGPVKLRKGRVMTSGGWPGLYEKLKTFKYFPIPVMFFILIRHSRKLILQTLKNGQS
jgi:hypothetical protein